MVDPIGSEANVAVPAAVRDAGLRFIYDTPRSIELLQAIGVRDTAEEVVAAAAGCDLPMRLPREVTLELTPRRLANGPLLPQYHAPLDRPPLDLASARELFAELAEVGDVTLTLGGLGDALLHPQWDALAQEAAEAGVLGIHIETDLLADDSEIEKLRALKICDAITVRLNADTGETYRRLMGRDAFKRVAKRMIGLMESSPGFIIPSLVKTPDTLAEMESFFERWVRSSGHAVIAPPQSGCGLMPEAACVPMAPPRRVPCRQLGGCGTRGRGGRISILSDGRVALCDQDWLGRGTLGRLGDTPLLDLWQRRHDLADEHQAVLCGQCSEWHRP